MRRFTAAVVTAGLCITAPLGASRRPDAPQFNTRDQFDARVNDREVQQILTRIRTSADSLLRGLVPASQGRGYGYRAQQGDVAYLVEDLAEAALHLNDHIVRRETTRTDVEEVLRRGVLVDEAMARQSRNTSVQNTWTTMRRDLDRLASAYSMNFDWRNPTFWNVPAAGVYSRWTGTYAIDTARSDNPVSVGQAALRGVSAAERTRLQRQIENRLDPPDRIAIDRNGSQVTIASTRGPQLTFTADGQSHTETGAAGRQVTTRASIYGDQLEVRTSGANNSDFAVTFEPIANGQSLRVTRRLYNDALRQPVTIQTTYRRTADAPDWSLYNENSGGRAAARANQTFAVPEGTTLVATLDQSVNLRSAREDDRVTMTVRNAPRAEWEGAVIEGYVIAQATRDDNRTGLSVGFDRIRLRNGRSADFDGDIERVVGPNGRDITFDGEQTRDSNQRDDAIQRGAIGAAVGAIIGAIAGGGKGAAIGAVLGGGGGAATVFIDGPNASELSRGTEFTIRTRGR
ncbi:MAG TPA: hypothetical protein VFV98_02350 [Vicinamibacterales bacterium]|nr:hypothetical protein [Vicinamibacterales bacterium]